MTVYRDAAHCIARVLSIETNDGTKKAGWQSKYEAPGWPEMKSAGSGLSSEERLTQDSMTRALLRRGLSPGQWHALVARRSVNNMEVKESAQWLADNATGPATRRFKKCTIAAWIMPKRSASQKSTRTLPDEFYLISSWDDEGRPEGTLRRWKSVTERWLNNQVSDAHYAVEQLLLDNNLKIDEVA